VSFQRFCFEVDNFLAPTDPLMMPSIPHHHSCSMVCPASFRNTVAYVHQYITIRTFEELRRTLHKLSPEARLQDHSNCLIRSPQFRFRAFLLLRHAVFSICGLTSILLDWLKFPAYQVSTQKTVRRFVASPARTSMLLLVIPKEAPPRRPATRLLPRWVRACATRLSN